jgi:hypothetical protein
MDREKKKGRKSWRKEEYNDNEKSWLVLKHLNDRRDRERERKIKELKRDRQTERYRKS